MRRQWRRLALYLKRNTKNVPISNRGWETKRDQKSESDKEYKPDCVVGSHADPVGDWPVLPHLLGQLLLDTEGLVGRLQQHSIIDSKSVHINNRIKFEFEEYKWRWILKTSTIVASAAEFDCALLDTREPLKTLIRERWGSFNAPLLLLWADFDRATT